MLHEYILLGNCKDSHFCKRSKNFCPNSQILIKVAKYCEKTCGKCRHCKDKRTGCEEYKRYCPNNNKVKQLKTKMARECKITCDICHKAQGEYIPVKSKKKV